MTLKIIYRLCLTVLLLNTVSFVKAGLPFRNTQLSFDERVTDLISRLTLEEKIKLLSYDSPGIPRLGIPAYNWWNECLHGVVRSGLATVFLEPIGMAAMWDTAQMYNNAVAISDEARAKYQDYISKDKHGIYQGLTFWSPNINIFRDLRWGRSMETYGEDPYLTAECAIPFVRGLQGDDPRSLKVIATAKHFAVHSVPESTRHSADVWPSDYDMAETYLSHFKRTIQESGGYSVMCAYQRYKGTTYVNGLGGAVKQKLISESEIDQSVKRTLLARFKLGQFDPDSLSLSEKRGIKCTVNVIGDKFICGD